MESKQCDECKTSLDKFPDDHEFICARCEDWIVCRKCAQNTGKSGIEKFDDDWICSECWQEYKEIGK